ncbi:metallophosphoesterase [Limnobacter parvus]|uniref:Metallophosphoesterase n=1 Tax=Limnobacter parvus TaxID=2939690 RepID=A0ABT1XH84_9BURK|nr:metallophosphoesterase [Limnobacter parvus]MCR2746646.1 metallophosphoesterase [Limnobacter parvus]
MSRWHAAFKHCAAQMMALCLLVLSPMQAAIAQVAEFSFALIGDQPYNDFFEPATDQLIQSISNDSGVQWILHIGDIKGGAEPCTDERLERRIQQLNRSTKPLVYVPGDNEWTDCHRDSAGGFNSQERLDFLRQLAFKPVNEVTSTLGSNTFPVRQQTEHSYPEHLMWQQGSTLFISLNVPGSNNDLHNPPSRKTSGSEVKRLLKQRKLAIADWLKDAEQLFQAKHNAPTETVITIQGNPIDGSGGQSTNPGKNGYAEFMKRIVEYINTTQRPVLLAHGDTHRFKWDRPSLKKFGGTAATDALFYRVESWGHPFLNVWVKVSVKPGAEVPFTVESISETAEPNN